MKNQTCPLCHQQNHTLFHKDRKRTYFCCETCALVFVPSEQFISAEAEKAEYDRHENSPEDQGYRKFLSRVFLPMQQVLEPQSQGLDFGSGPGPTLSLMFEEAGHTMAIYDHFYAPNLQTLERKYDFITATEVVEHLHDPATVLDQLWSCLLSGGWMGIMTKLVLDANRFAGWHYKNDLTHVCFFSKKTFEWWAHRSGAQLEFVGTDVILLGK